MQCGTGHGGSRVYTMRLASSRLMLWEFEQGFPSKPRTAADGGLLASANAAEVEKKAELRRGLLDLGIAWGLVALCCTHHVGHFAHALG